MNGENIKNIIQGVIDGIIEGFTPLAQKLEVPAKEILGWAVKHNYAVAVAETVIGIVVIIAIVKLLKKFWNYHDCGEIDRGDACGCIVPKIFAVIATSIITTFIIFNFYDAILRFVAPEYMTAEDIIELFNPKPSRGCSE